MDDDTAEGDLPADAVRSLRVRSFLARWFPAVAAALVVLALFGGWVAYDAHLSPGFDTRERTVSSWERTASFDHGATVVRENPVFPVGSDLTNREFYYRQVSPVLDGAFAFGYAATDGGSLTLAVDVRLVVRAVSSGEDGGGEGEGTDRTEFWRVERSLANETVEDVPPGETVSASFPVDVPALANRSENITERLGGTPGQVETTVQATVRGTGTVNGQQVERRWSFDMPIVVESAIYRVEDPGTVQTSEARTETVRVPVDVGPLRSVGGPALALGALAALGGLVYRRRTEGFDLDARERELLAYRDDRAEFDEWIVAVAPPRSVYDRPRAHAATLGDLVDFAIDTDNSVLSPPEERAYYVVEDDYLYVYDPPSLPPVDEGALEAEAGHAAGTGDGEIDTSGPDAGDAPAEAGAPDEPTGGPGTDGTAGPDGTTDGFEAFDSATETSEAPGEAAHDGAEEVSHDGDEADGADDSDGADGADDSDEADGADDADGGTVERD